MQEPYKDREYDINIGWIRLANCGFYLFVFKTDNTLLASF